VKRYSFAFTGLINCGSCGRAITAEHKVNAYGSRYVYYHCSKSGLGPRCPERSVQAEDLERQLVAWLRGINFGEETARRMRALFNDLGRGTSASSIAVRQSVEKALRDTQAQAAELLGMRARQLITDEEFIPRRAALKEEVVRLTRRLEELARPEEQELIPLLNAGVSLSNQAAELFRDGSVELKRRIIGIACSNLRLTNKILSIEAAQWLCLMREIARCLCVRGRRDEVLIFQELLDLVDQLRADSSLAAKLAIMGETMISDDLHAEAA
jgi:hypothetical protein